MGTLATPLQQWVISDAVAGWTQNVTFAQFDPSLGTLLDVRIGLTGDISGGISAENLQATASALMASLPGGITVYGPDGNIITSVRPSLSVSANLGAFDGTADYIGASGLSFTGHSDSQSAAAYRPDAAALAQFIGTGSVGLSVGSWAALTAAGPANLQLLSTANAGATITLQYDYLAPGDTDPGQGGGQGGGVVVTTTNNPIPIVFAGSVTTAPQVFTVADSTTDWSDLLAVSRFDPTLGMLEVVNITLTGDIHGSIAAENLGGAPAAFYIGQTAALGLSLPGSVFPLSLSLSVDASGTLGVFDGSADLSGTSAESDPDLAQSNTTTFSVMDAGGLAAFTGAGTVDLGLSATGASTINGPGNLLTRLLAQAGAEVQISYTYLPDAAANTACFAAGTRIATEDGDMPVERLQVGQRVRSMLRGGSAPVVWIGYRQVACDRHPRPDKVWPVCVRAWAFGPHMPARDLFLSPDHAVFVEGVLIPVRHLVNGSTVRQVPVESITYYHVELDTHDVLLAERLPAESFLNGGDRSAFSNGGRVVQVHPEFNVLTWEAEGCAPLVVTGPALDAVKSDLAERARRLGRLGPATA
jgi:hypothetical protein